MGAKDRAASVARLRRETGEATPACRRHGPYAGEGFDCHPLETLFLGRTRIIQGEARPVRRTHTRTLEQTTAEGHEYVDETPRVLPHSLQARTRLRQPGR